jgi:cytochrome P450
LRLVPEPTVTSAPLPSLNPVSPENLLEPVPLYRELRGKDPVYWSDTVRGWFLTRHDDVLSCLRDPRLSAERAAFFEQQLQGLGLDVIQEFLRIIRLQMPNHDGPNHVRLRRQANVGFTPQALESLCPAIRRTMGALVERVRPLGRMDLVANISHQLPPMAIAELFDIPEDERGRFMGWARPIADFCTPGAGTDMVQMARRADEAIREFRLYLERLIEERRANPGKDVLSMMIHAQEEGRMTVDELVANSILLLFAGHTTTTDQLSNGIHDLLRHPDELRKLQDDPRLLKSAVEEMIRFNPSVPSVFRIVKEDLQLRGKTLRKGEVVFLWYAAANRDPEVFPDPDRFDITRKDLHHKHLGFGMGAHHCLGADLARRELEIALEVLLERLPTLRLEEGRPPELKCNSLSFRGFNSLHVQW